MRFPVFVRKGQEKPRITTTVYLASDRRCVRCWFSAYELLIVEASELPVQIICLHEKSKAVRDLSTSQQQPRMHCHVVWYICTDVSREAAAPTVMVYDTQMRQAAVPLKRQYISTRHYGVTSQKRIFYKVELVYY